MTITLRDGSTAEDPRLGRLRHFDPRSRNHPIRTLVGGKDPRSWTWRLNVWLNQESEGSCTGFGTAHDLNARPVVTRVDREYARKIYFEAQLRDPWEGGAYPGAHPFYEGSSVLAAVQTCQAWGHYEAYRWAFGLNDVVLALGYAGPCILGIDWHRNMSQPDADGRIRPTGSLDGGHAILAYKVQMPTKRRKVAKVWLHNSWGQSWGLNGRCWLTFDDLDQLLHAGGECCIPVKRRRVAA